MRAVYGQYTTPPCTVKTDRGLGNEVIECETVPGVGKDMGWQIVVGSWWTDNARRRQASRSCRTKLLQLLRSEMQLPQRTSGMEEVRIDGQNFGPPDNNQSQYFTRTGLGMTNMRQNSRRLLRLLCKM